ncbi:MAG: hypothetical protein E4G94_07110 [ANME-2 cluster archaeon]|nr:MAG: hypothetical protein E4G94_07110 [ANME-2 cluster archaeon]
MKRRNSFRYLAVLAGTPIISGINLTGCKGNYKDRLPDMHIYWQNQKTRRPFAPAIDQNSIMWHGREHFFRTDLKNNVSTKIDNQFMEGKPLSSVFCHGDKVYIVSQKSPYMFLYSQKTGQFRKLYLPDMEGNIWFGVKVPNTPDLYLYARNRGKLIHWDCDLDKGGEIPFPDDLDLWSGFYVKEDAAIYSFTLDAKPARLVRFDLKSVIFDTVIDAPEPELEITGVNPIGNTLYCSDRFTGRIFPYNWEDRIWEKHIAIPGLGTDFGFVGIGCVYQGLALYSLSTFAGQMKWDFNNNKYLSGKDDSLGIDGKKHHFLNKYLVFDPKTIFFSYLEAREEGRYPLLCYSLVHDDKLIITGFDCWNSTDQFADMETEGELMLFRN